MATSEMADNFASIASHLISVNPSWYHDKFASLKTNLERVNFVYEDMKSHNLFSKLIPDMKNDFEAIRIRERGNKLFTSGKYLDALEMYTNSIATAETDKIRALGYSNRSYCLHKLKMYTECISDINRAFANNYAGEKKEKLIARRKEAERLQKPLKNNYEEIPEITEKNRSIQSAGNCVKIEEDEVYGRKVVAARTIEIGEVISVEKPFASVLKNGFTTHCHHCMKLCYNLIPCSKCTKTLYCTEECLEQAQNPYHQYECPILLTLSKLDTSWVLFALKVALKVALLAKDDYHHLNSLKYHKNQVYKSDRYKEIHNLATSIRKVYMTVSAAMAFELMKTTDFFKNQDMEDKFKEVLLLQIVVAFVNGLSIYEFTPASNGLNYERSEFAVGIYAFSSLYNHSCNPNVYKISYGSTLVVRAVNTIKAGQQCFITYGPIYDEMSLTDRTILYKSFSFECKCRACQEDWNSHLVTFFEAMNLSMGSRKGTLLYNKLIMADVKVAKKLMPKVIARLKQCEEKEPKGNAPTLKKIMGSCLETLGNKRIM